MRDYTKKIGLLFTSALMMSCFTFSCASSSPIDDTDYVITTQLIGCRILGIKDSYHINDSVDLQIVSEQDFRLPPEIGQLEVRKFDGDIVQSRYDFIDDDNAKISFKMPDSNVSILCTAISTKKYKLDIDFGSDYTFVEGPDAGHQECLPGTKIELHLRPKNFTSGIAVPNNISLPADFSYHCCVDALGAVITGTMPNQPVTYTYTGTSKPTFGIYLSSSMPLGYSLVATLDSFKYDPKYNDSSATESVGVYESWFGMHADYIIPSGRYGYASKFTIEAIFKYTKNFKVSVNGLPEEGALKPESWQEALPDYPTSRPKFSQKSEKISDNKVKVTIKGPVVGSAFKLDLSGWDA